MNYRSIPHHVNRLAARGRAYQLHLTTSLPELTCEQATGRPFISETPAILDDICLPPYLGYSKYHDFSALIGIAKATQPQIVFEIGTAHGNLAANLCATVPDARVFTVNAPVEEQTGEVITYKLTREDIGRVYRRHGFQNRVTQIYANSLHLDLSNWFSEPVIDLAIVDGCHDVDFVLNDFHKVYPWVRPGGVILLHDTWPDPNPENWQDGDRVFHREHLVNSYVACMMLRKDGYPVSHLTDTLWGFCRKPAQ